MSDPFAQPLADAFEALPPPDPETRTMIEILASIHSRIEDERRAHETPPLPTLTGLVLSGAMTADGAIRKGRRDVAEALLVETAVNAILALLLLRGGRP